MSPSASPPEPVVRHAARVLLIDEAGRVLLFANTLDTGERVWVPPGGGCEPGETAEETVRRELAEETGLADVGLSGEIGRRRVIVRWGGVTYDCWERWFLARAPAFTIDTRGFTDLEVATISDYRWWTVAEMAVTTERLVPADLAALAQRLLRDGVPPEPLALGR